MSDPTYELIHAALTTSMAAPIVPERGMGCCRVYVEIIAGNAYLGGARLEGRALVNQVAKACKALGLIFQRTAHYGMRNAIYIGYDNCDGHALARGTVVADALRAAGVPAYRSEHGD